MLFEYQFIDHPVNQLQGYISDYFITLRNIGGKRQRFTINLCHKEFQPYVNRAPKLEKHLEIFFNAYIKLNNEERDLVFQAFCCCNKIREQLQNEEKCYPLGTIPEEIRKPAKDLFKYMYKNTLNSVGDVKDHYKQFYKNRQSNICPFCGIERILPPDHYKQDYDHLLCKKTYPFAAVNMENLVPMGRDCNTIYKKEKDILHGEGGIRRKYFYPFQLNGIKIIVKLEGSTLPTPSDRKGNWVVSLLPCQEEVLTWDSVFDIRKRYKDVVFENEYADWLQQFIGIARRFSVIEGQWDENRLKETLLTYLKSLQNENIDDYKNKKFLKYSLFEFIHNEAETSFFKSVSRMIMAG